MGNTGLRKLNEAHEEACLQLALGHTVAEVARRMGRTDEWVRNVRSSDVGQARIAELRERRIAAAMKPHEDEARKLLYERAMRQAERWMDTIEASTEPTREYIQLWDKIVEHCGPPKLSKLELSAKRQAFADRILPQLDEIAAGRRERLDVEGGPEHVQALPSPAADPIPVEFTDLEDVKETSADEEEGIPADEEEVPI